MRLEIVYLRNYDDAIVIVNILNKRQEIKAYIIYFLQNLLVFSYKNVLTLLTLHSLLHHNI